MSPPYKVIAGVLGTIVLMSAIVGTVLRFGHTRDRKSGTGLSLNPTLKENTHRVIQELQRKIYNNQNKFDIPSLPPFTWKKRKGLYGSEVRLNFHGSSQMALIRDFFKIYDNNIFATSWITTCLLEAHLYGSGPSPSKEHVDLAVGAALQYTDKNQGNRTSQMTFWPQSYNQTTKTWQSTPENLLDFFDIVLNEPTKIIEMLLKFIHLDQIEKVLEMATKSAQMYLKAFHIPADFDDTFVNIGLGSLLQLASGDSPDAWHSWSSANVDLTSVLGALKKYAYRPFSVGNTNVIDTRTYFYQRKFLSENHKNDLALVTTWLQTSDEARALDDKGVSMPFYVNNVDVTVACNTIFGLTAGFIQGMFPPATFDSDVQQIYLNTSAMVAYQIAANFSARRDLALTYYPSKFESYWFAARTVALLGRHHGNIPFKVMEDVETLLSSALRGAATQDILHSAQTSPDHPGTFFDDFLGDGDLDNDNNTIVKAEDRIFTTSMAANTLLDTWTRFNSTSKKLHWANETPSKVKDILQQIVTWLVENSLSGRYKPWNAFFSGSGKGIDSMPFWYPANVHKYVNGTNFDPSKFPNATAFMVGAQGFIKDDDYQRMLNLTHFGRKTPMDFKGYNDRSEPYGYFPLWSSDAYTYSTVLLALSKFENIQ